MHLLKTNTAFIYFYWPSLTVWSLLILSAAPCLGSPQQSGTLDALPDTNGIWTWIPCVSGGNTTTKPSGRLTYVCVCMICILLMRETWFCQRGLKSPIVKHKRTGQTKRRDSDGCDVCSMVIPALFVSCGVCKWMCGGVRCNTRANMQT